MGQGISLYFIYTQVYLLDKFQEVEVLGQRADLLKIHTHTHICIYTCQAALSGVVTMYSPSTKRRVFIASQPHQTKVTKILNYCKIGRGKIIVLF